MIWAGERTSYTNFSHALFKNLNFDLQKEPDQNGPPNPPRGAQKASLLEV